MGSINKKYDTMNEAKARSAATAINEYLKEMEIKHGLLQAVHDPVWGSTERNSKPCCYLQDRMNRRIIINWVDFRMTHVHLDVHCNVYLDMIFNQLNILVFGTNVGVLLPYIADHSNDLVAEEVFATGGTGLDGMCIEVLTSYVGHGVSVFGTDQSPLDTPPGMTRELERLTGRSLPHIGAEAKDEELNARLMEQMGLTQGAEDLGHDQPLNERSRRAIQHKKLVKEKKDAKKEGRKLDSSKFANH